MSQRCIHSSNTGKIRWNFFQVRPSHLRHRICMGEGRLNKQWIIGGERSMRFFKILPAAAGVIALSATVSFARDMRDLEEDDFSRVLIVSVNSKVDADIASHKDGQGGHAYHVEINRGEKKWLVSVDAFTGKILDKRDVTAATV